MRVTYGEKAQSAHANRLSNSVPANYTVYMDGETTYAEACAPGLSDISGLDAATVINAAITAGNSIYIKAGTYNLSDPIIVTENTTICGSGKYTTILYGLDPTESIIKGVYDVGTIKRFVTIKDIHCRSGLYGLELTYLYESKFENIELTNQANCGAKIISCCGLQMDFITAQTSGDRGFRFENCNTARGILYAFSSASHGIDLYDCQGFEILIDVESSAAYSLEAAGILSCRFSGWIERGTQWSSVHILGGTTFATSLNNHLSNLWIDGNAKTHGILIQNADYTKIASSVYVQNTTGTAINLLDATARYTIIEPGGLTLTDGGANTQTPTVEVPYILDDTDANATKSNIGDHLTISCADNQAVSVRFNFPVPFGLLQVIDANLYVLSPCGGGTVMRWNVATDFATKDEDYNVHSDSIAATDTTLAANKFEALDLKDALTGVAGGDRVGVTFQREGNHANDTLGDVLHVHSFVLRYI